MAVAATSIENVKGGIEAQIGLFTLDFASTLTLVQSAALDLTFPGAKIGDFVIIQPMVKAANQVFTGYVDAADNVKAYFQNVTAATIDPASQVFRVMLIRGIGN